MQRKNQKVRTKRPAQAKPQAKRRIRFFEVTFESRIYVDQAVIDQGLRDDNPILGKGATEEEVVEHLAFNLVVNCLSLSDIDGYANRKDDEAEADPPTNGLVSVREVRVRG